MTASRALARARAAALFAFAVSPGCVSHSHVTELRGVMGLRGVPIVYQTTTAWGLHALWIFPIVGNVKTSKVIEKFAAEASDRGASRLRIVSTQSAVYWYLLPPISFFVHPVLTVIEGEVEGTTFEGG